MMSKMSAPTETARAFAVLISGTPGAGKTTLGWELSRRLHVPFLSRDVMKTSLHVTHRSTDPNEFWRFAEAAFDIFYDTTTRLVQNGVSVVAEAAFHTGRSEESIAKLAKSCDVIHLALTTPNPIALARYTERAQAGRRHPAHNDLEFAAQMADGTKDVETYRLRLPYPTLAVDASKDWHPGLDEIMTFIERSR